MIVDNQIDLFFAFGQKTYLSSLLKRSYILSVSQSKGKISQNFVAYSEYMTFKQTR